MTTGVLAHVQVPTVFPEVPWLIAGFIALLVVPPIISVLIVNHANNKWARTADEYDRGAAMIKPRGYGRAAAGGLLLGALLASIAGLVVWVVLPYIAGINAHNAVKDYYQTNVVAEGGRLPVNITPSWGRAPEETPVIVYRVPGGNPEDCIVTTYEDEYTLFCGDPYEEFVPDLR